VILVVGRVGKSDLLSGALCCAALLLAAGTVGFADFGSGSRPATTSAGIQTAAGQESSSPSDSVATPRSLTADSLSRVAIWLALGLGLVAAATAVDGSTPRAWHRFAILLLSLSGVLLAAIANDLAIVVIAMELASLPATALLFFERDTPEATAAARQSLALNLFALAMLVAGAVLFAVVSGTTNLGELRVPLPHVGAARHLRVLKTASPVAGEIGCVFLVAGLGVHFLAAPFQLAAAEIFESARSWTIGLTALVPRGAALLLMVRVLVYGPPRLQGTVQTLLTAVGFLTILIGGLLVVSQTRVRRLLAFVVVFQSGLILVALAAGCSEAARPAATPWLDAATPGGVGSACLCFALDSLALIGLLALFGSRERFGRPVEDMTEFADAIRGDGLTAAAVCVLVAALAGVPPFAGFWPRVDILRSLLSISFPAENGFLPHQNIGYVIVAMAAAVGLIVVAAVTLGFVKRVLLDDLDVPRVVVLRDGGSAGAKVPKRAALAIGVLAATAVIILGLIPRPAALLAARAAVQDRAIAQASTDRAGALPTASGAAADGGTKRILGRSLTPASSR
jgi:NADH:ubiquinone oxidoreductase subunit 2 (subunit N)